MFTVICVRLAPGTQHSVVPVGGVGKSTCRLAQGRSLTRERLLTRVPCCVGGMCRCRTMPCWANFFMSPIHLITDFMLTVCIQWGQTVLGKYFSVFLATLPRHSRISGTVSLSFVSAVFGNISMLPSFTLTFQGTFILPESSYYLEITNFPVSLASWYPCSGIQKISAQ